MTIILTQQKLNAVFADLRRHNLVARQNIYALATLDMDTHDKVGVVFTEPAAMRVCAQHGRLLIGYGSVTGKASDDARIAQQVVTTCKAHGLLVTWNGSVYRRVTVYPKALADYAVFNSATPLRNPDNGLVYYREGDWLVSTGFRSIPLTQLGDLVANETLIPLVE